MEMPTANLQEGNVCPMEIDENILLDRQERIEKNRSQIEKFTGDLPRQTKP